MNKNKKIVIFTGGTGGHVIPAVNFANFLILEGYECSLILDKRGAQYSKNFKGNIHIINSAHLSGNIFIKIKSFINLLLGFFQSFILLIKLRPKDCISFGSYATFMPLIIVLILKLFMKIDIYIHEQNSVIGKVNLFFLPYAKYFFTNFTFVTNLNNKYNNKKIYVGLPSNRKIDFYSSKINEKQVKKIILIYGGSQGAVSLIKNLLLIISNLDNNSLTKIKLIIQSPKNIFDTINESLKDLNIEYEIKEFYNNINDILSITDIAITRAGAGTINDLITYKIPSIIFPLPHSIYNHQFYNAKYLVDKKAAILFEENKFHAHKYSAIFKKFISDEKKQKNMKNALDKIIVPDANRLMINKIII